MGKEKRKGEEEGKWKGERVIERGKGRDREGKEEGEGKVKERGSGR